MHEHYKEAISLLACGELPDQDREAVERHLAECASCRSEYEALQRLCGGIRNLAEQDERAEVPAGLSERLEKSLRRPAHAGRWAAFTTAACVLIALGAWAIGRAVQVVPRSKQEQPSAIRIMTTKSPTAVTASVQHASCIACCRAWLESPDALDQMLTRDAAALLQPERSPNALDARRFLQTMNLDEEEHNAKHSMRCGAFGSLV